MVGTPGKVKGQNDLCSFLFPECPLLPSAALVEEGHFRVPAAMSPNQDIDLGALARLLAPQRLQLSRGLSCRHILGCAQSNPVSPHGLGKSHNSWAEYATLLSSVAKDLLVSKPIVLHSEDCEVGKTGGTHAVFWPAWDPGQTRVKRAGVEVPTCLCTEAEGQIREDAGQMREVISA